MTSNSEWQRTASVYIMCSQLKMMRETLSKAQALLDDEMDRKRLENLIDQIDIYRPVDSAGNHGDLHTLKCGCEDR